MNLNIEFFWHIYVYIITNLSLFATNTFALIRDFQLYSKREKSDQN